MLTGVRIEGASGASVTFLIDSWQTVGYIIRSITGIGPVKASISTSSFGNIDGAFYQNARNDARSVVLSVELISDYASQSIDQLRGAIYDVIMPKSECKVIFQEDGVERMYGIARVEDMQVDYFVRYPTVSISLLFPDPAFYSVEEYTAPLTSGQDCIIEYQGSLPTGFEASLVGASGAFSFMANQNGINVGTNGQSQVTGAGEGVEISSIDRNIGIYRIGASDKTSLYANLQESTLATLQLHRGTNTVRTNYGGDGAGPVGTINYREKFGAIG